MKRNRLCDHRWEYVLLTSALSSLSSGSLSSNTITWMSAKPVHLFSWSPLGVWSYSAQVPPRFPVWNGAQWSLLHLDPTADKNNDSPPWIYQNYPWAFADHTNYDPDADELRIAYSNLFHLSKDREVLHICPPNKPLTRTASHVPTRMCISRRLVHWGHAPGQLLFTICHIQKAPEKNRATSKVGGVSWH